MAWHAPDERELNFQRLEIQPRSSEEYKATVVFQYYSEGGASYNAAISFVSPTNRDALAESEKIIKALENTVIKVY